MNTDGTMCRFCFMADPGDIQQVARLFSVPDELVGRPISSVVGGFGDAVGAFFGIGEHEILRKGQILTASEPIDPRGNKFKLFTEPFTPTTANAPAIESLEASKAEIGEKFDVLQGQLEADKDPLNARYDNLVEQLRGREAKDTKRTSERVSTEFGVRGVDPRSGVFQTKLDTELSDISQFFAGAQKEVGFAREGDLKDIRDQIQTLGLEEIETFRDIDNEIARLKAAGAQLAQVRALELFKFKATQEFESRFDDLNRKLKEAEIESLESSSALSSAERTAFDLFNQLNA